MDPNSLNSPNYTHATPITHITPLRLTKAELERIYYLNDTKTPDGRNMSDVLGPDYFPEDTKVDHKDESWYERNETTPKSTTTAGQYKAIIKLYENQIAAFKNELRKVYVEMGCSEEEILEVLKTVSASKVGI